jgi:hypothetical protein
MCRICLGNLEPQLAFSPLLRSPQGLHGSEAQPWRRHSTGISGHLENLQCGPELQHHTVGVGLGDDDTAVLITQIYGPQQTFSSAVRPGSEGCRMSNPDFVPGEQPLRCLGLSSLISKLAATL